MTTWTVDDRFSTRNPETAPAEARSAGNNHARFKNASDFAVNHFFRMTLRILKTHTPTSIDETEPVMLF